MRRDLFYSGLMKFRFDGLATRGVVLVTDRSRRGGEDRNEGAQRPPRAPPAQDKGRDGSVGILTGGPQWALEFAVLLLALAPLSVYALDLNTATRAQLEQLSGVGVTMAERLLEERARQPFRDWDDLVARVKGMRGARVERLREQGVRIDPVPAPREQK